MSSSVLRRACAFGVLIAALSTLVFTGTASAQATVGTFYNQETLTFTDVSLCTGLSGTVTNTVTEAQQDRGTLYAADGQVIGKVTVFTLTHQTWRDLNGNGLPDPGEFTAIVDQFRVTCP